MTPPLLHQLNLIARDVDAAVDFYRMLGLPVESAPGDQHVELKLKLPNGLSIEWDSSESAALWDSGWKGTGGAQGIVLGFQLATRVAVDEKYSELTTAGYPGHQSPYDAFWGARYAIVEDPDGNSVGLMSPIEPDRKYWPPVPAPSA